MAGAGLRGRAIWPSLQFIRLLAWNIVRAWRIAIGRIRLLTRVLLTGREVTSVRWRIPGADVAFRIHQHPEILQGESQQRQAVGAWQRSVVAGNSNAGSHPQTAYHFLHIAVCPFHHAEAFIEWAALLVSETITIPLAES